ncbi:helix-turn-helix transcriptional regulator [Mobilitalea sibirica]|uniref:Helix-turn-helix transcriptional regulator n=1 Tax=Mobilitalea sibirica TaxID=1462919 RepID=A0A8J7H7Q2_9FIRM|nr:AraC family transcriptional regulator [Mobilitalea sibirica]MBH1939620.1 helix-turn-helix transcriptional regulator [Mobilitalea sibirica]
MNQLDEEVLNNIVATVDYYNHRICTPSWNISEDIINFVDITYVISGQAEYTINRNKYIVSSGDLLCIPAGSLRAAISCSESLMECYSINGVIRNIEGEDITMPLPIICNIGIHKDIIELYRDLNAVWRLRDPGYVLKARAIYLMLLQRYFQLIIYQKDTSIIDKRIKKVLHYMSNHYHEPLTVQKMAQLVNLSDMYFGSLFKQETGMSFRKYLTLIRINRAEDMLYSGEFKVNEIADACGFSDVFYFSRLFKENRGYAPSNAIRTKKTKI